MPFGTYQLLFEAPREQYAILITMEMFWIFEYWGIVGPLLLAYKIRMVIRAIEQAHTQEDLAKVLINQETGDIAIDLIASQNGIPRFLASRVYTALVRRLSERKTEVRSISRNRQEGEK
ncbi:MAG: hypothetical protein HQM10_13530 [Candidatus Riflebacteria bacterium]|nr:hypothetical protein [Candidatus Riflebacteria bacterium]